MSEQPSFEKKPNELGEGGPEAYPQTLGSLDEQSAKPVPEVTEPVRTEIDGAVNAGDGIVILPPNTVETPELKEGSIGYSSASEENQK